MDNKTIARELSRIARELTAYEADKFVFYNDRNFMKISVVLRAEVDISKNEPEAALRKTLKMFYQDYVRAKNLAERKLNIEWVPCMYNSVLSQPGFSENHFGSYWNFVISVDLREEKEVRTSFMKEMLNIFIKKGYKLKEI